MSDVKKRKGLDITDRNTRHLAGRLIREVARPYAWKFVWALLFMTAFSALNAAMAWLMKPVVNKVFVERDATMLWMIAGAVVAVFFLKSACSFAQDSVLSFIGHRIIADMQARLFSHMIRLDVASFQERHSGGMISHFTYDINALRSAINDGFVSLGRDLLSVLFLVAVMFQMDWVLALVGLVVAPLSAQPIQRLGKRIRKVAGQTQDEMSRLTTTLSQSFQGVRMVKAFGLEDHESAKVTELADNIFRLNFRAARVRASVQPIVDCFGGIAVAAVIVYGGMRVISGVTDSGSFFAFITAVVAAYQPMRGLGKANNTLNEGMAAASRVFSILDRQTTLPEPAAPKTMPHEAGSVRFEKVCFSYNEDASALNDVSFEAPAGGVTALVGPSGAGKSTVFSLIPRFYDPQSGRVLVNGVDVREVNSQDLRHNIAVVSQEVILFDETILDNIRLGRLDASEEEVYEAARAAAADEFIRALPDGYQTLVGEQGLRLSGGQRQRVAIARALLKDAPILLLDEATSALDTESERLIQDALQILMKGRTTLVIAHRLSTIRDADVIHAFDDGRVVESGNHAELLAKDGLYAKLHALQYRKAEGVG